MIEMLISVFLLTLVMLGALAFIPAARMATDRQRAVTVATNIARTQLENLRRLNFDNSLLDPIPFSSPATSTVTVGNFSYQVSKVVVYMDPATQDFATGATDMKGVEIMVQGTGRTQGVRVVERTMISRFQ